MLKINRFAEPDVGFWISRKVRHDEIFVGGIGIGVKRPDVIVSYRDNGKLEKGWGKPIRTLPSGSFQEMQIANTEDNIFYAAKDSDGSAHLGIVTKGGLDEYLVIKPVNEETGKFKFNSILEKTY